MENQHCTPSCSDFSTPSANTTPKSRLSSKMSAPVSKYGFKVKFDHQFPEKWTQKHRPTLFQIWNMIGTIWRYVVYSIYTLLYQGKKPIMNFFSPVEPQQRYGVPIGGIGGGSINRGWRGEFCRYQMVPGMYEYKTMWANQFILTVHSEKGYLLYQQVLSPHPPPSDGSLSAWKWNFPRQDGSYTGLYPRAWYTYDIHELGLTLVCSQVSPVLPNNYKDSSVPGVVFEWTIMNQSSDSYNLSITFTFQNGRGSKQDTQGGARGLAFEKVLDVQDDSSSGIQGVHILDEMNGMKQAFTLSALTNDDNEVTTCSYFDPKGSGDVIWIPLQNRNHRKFDKGPDDDKPTKPGQALGVGLTVKKHIKAGTRTGNSETGDSGTGDFNINEETIEMALVWTMGEVKFRNKAQTHRRYYSKWFPGDNNVESAELISEYALTHYKEWNQAIDNWQKPTLEDKNLPEWYKSCVFNELYYISDGGTVWFRDEDETWLDPDDPRIQFGRFAYLEGHEYRMYNTFDVHFYASFSLGTLWPRLEQCLMQEFRDSVYAVINQERWLIHSGEWCQRKKPMSIPHDLGDPEEEPFLLLNAYNIYDVSDWKDLNLKFIISLYRDFTVSHDLAFLARMFPCCLDLIRKCDSFDRQGLGIVQNGGFPDQTFDCWTMTGVSAYCGGLHIAALASLVEMAALLGYKDEKQEFQTKLTKASQVYHDLLWTGSYYRFDSSQSKHSRSIMADQLCGYLFLKASGIDTKSIFPVANIEKTLDTIFSTNVKGFQLGSLGAVNGMNPDGTLDRFAIQSEEVWTGVTYLLAATMLYEGRHDHAWVTAGGLYRTIYERIGLGFETPEGLTGDKTYRSGGYMRALAVYAMQQAYNKGNKSH